MDKIAPMLAWLNKNKFWLGSFFLAATMLGMWFMTTGALQSETSSFRSAVSSQISSANGIRSVTAADIEEGVVAHPNSSTEEGMKQELEEAVDSIVKAWEMRHKSQASILKWPTDIIGNEQFVKVFGRFDPPETFPSTFSGLGMEQYLALYRNNIPRQMTRICKDILRTNWMFSEEKLREMEQNSRSGGAFDPTNERSLGRIDEEELAGVAVVWERSNQVLWYQKLTEFQEYDDHNLSTPDPTPLQVYMLQQDLWLLEAMFTIIRSVNGDVDANDLATIKTIDHVAFGREARTQLGELTPVDAKLGGAGLETDDGMFGGGGFGADTAVEPAVDDFDQSASNSPFHGRYVDKEFKPYPADVVRGVITGETLPDENIELIVSKRVPVRIALKMDERRIADFIAACANSPFAFEIHQVRINRHTPGEGITLNGGAKKAGGMGGGMMDDMMMDDMGMMDDMMMDDMMGMGGMGGNTMIEDILESTDVEVRTNYDVSVEFYGIVKIYNPVREQFLRRAAGLEENEPDPSDAAMLGRAGDMLAIRE